MQLSGKITNILSSNKWYHATTMDGFLSLKQNGVIAKYNQGKPLDFGYGFYLTLNEEMAERYIKRLYQADDDVFVITEYTFSPLPWFTTEEYNAALFPKFDDNFARFVMNNRLMAHSLIQQHAYDVIYGVMSDSAPVQLLMDYRVGAITEEQALEGLKKSNSMKQLSVHNQQLCDMLVLSRAYQFDFSTDTYIRKELDIHE